MSLTTLFHTILGDRERQLEQERQEHLAAKLKYDACQKSVTAIEADIAETRGKLAQFGDLDAQYQSLLLRKTELISQAQSTQAETVLQLDEKAAELKADVKELHEAAEAGHAALTELMRVVTQLKSASTWGMWDLVGGGVIATAVKHSKIDDARESVHRAQRLLRRFERELADLHMRERLNIEIGSFATFADYFFDGLIADWIVQSKIQQSLSHTASAAKRVKAHLEILLPKLEQRQAELSATEAERVSLIEQAS